MEEGFPGNLTIKMTYTLTDDNALKIEYKATTDKSTPINLTNHTFFNLHGEGNRDINDHIMYINASNYIPVNKVLIPIGKITSVEETPFDFRKPITIGSRLNETNQQFSNCKGYDHTFVLNREDSTGLELAATVREPISGRFLKVYTTEPGIQFYGGNFFTGAIIGPSNKPYGYRSGLALETQHFPDSPNQPNFPSTILNPGEVYLHTCIYKFGIDK